MTTALAGYGRVFRMYYFVGQSGYDDQLAGKIVEDGALGIIGIGVGSPEVAERLVATGLPTVFVDSYLGKVKADLVNAANREGMKEATRHLLNTVSGKLAFLGPEQRHQGMAHARRYEGFVDAHRAAGRKVDESLVFEVYSAEPEPAREIGSRIVELPERPGGVVCSDDGLAYGVLDVFRSEDVAVPGEISVVGYANSVYCLMTIPAISSVAPDRQTMGQEAVTLLEKRLEDPQRPAVTVEVPTRLILRQSTLPVGYPGLG